MSIINPINTIAVVIPSYKVKKHILGVIESIGPEVSCIYVVDDCCPDESGKFVEDNCKDPRVKVIKNSMNLGVGGAVMVGYQNAIEGGATVLVKIDGDGQMDSSQIWRLVQPVLQGTADYAKGNRFFNLEKIMAMPKIRIFGNAALSMMTKLSAGYWNIFDPTNGFTAIHSQVAKKLPFDKISKRYFFETDMLFRLNILKALVQDVPMDARYDDEVSNLKISHIIGEFLGKHFINFHKRIFYNYYLRDMSIASIELPLGIAFMLFGVIFGGYHWISSSHKGMLASPGTVMLAGMSLLIGIQLILAFLAYDIASVPTQPIHDKDQPKLKLKISKAERQCSHLP